MALNWTMLNPNRSPVPLPDEMVITTIDSGVELVLRVPDAPPSGISSSGGSGGVRNHKAMGKIWVTDHRFIFTTLPDTHPSFESLSVPLHSILSTQFMQPTFGNNYLTFDVKPSPEGGLTDGTKVEIRFKDRAMFEFVAVLEKTRERAIYMKRQKDSENDEGLPSYTSPAASSSVSIAEGVPDDNPPGYDV